MADINGKSGNLCNPYSSVCWCAKHARMERERDRRVNAIHKVDDDCNVCGVSSGGFGVECLCRLCATGGNRDGDGDAGCDGSAMPPSQNCVYGGGVVWCILSVHVSTTVSYVCAFVCMIHATT